MTYNYRYPFKKSWRWGVVRFFDWALSPFSKHFKEKKFPERVERILVVRLDQIGDLVCSIPTFPILKKRYPNAKIYVLTGREGKAVFSQNPYVDEIIVFHSNWFTRSTMSHPFEGVGLIFYLRKKAFDLGFDLRGDLRNILMMTLAGVRYRIGYGIAGGGALLHEMCTYDANLHQAELNVRLVTDREVEKTQLRPEIYLTDEEKSEADRLLKDHGIGNRLHLIAVHPEAGYPSKEWEDERFNTLTRELLTDPRNVVILLGISKKAREIANNFLGVNRVVNLVGTLTLRKMIAVLSCCHLFIGNDSGPSHIAQALGIPLVVIASGTNEYGKWGVWTRRARVLKYSVPCSPCHLKYCNVEGHPCMSKISTEAVVSAVRELIPEGVR